jgi:hypothetical protein
MTSLRIAYSSRDALVSVRLGNRLLGLKCVLSSLDLRMSEKARNCWTDQQKMEDKVCSHLK